MQLYTPDPQSSPEALTAAAAAAPAHVLLPHPLQLSLLLLHLRQVLLLPLLLLLLLLPWSFPEQVQFAACFAGLLQLDAAVRSPCELPLLHASDGQPAAAALAPEMRSEFL
jgi:hypothetical protein